MEDVMAAMREKSPNSIGNTYAFIVNERLYDQLGRILRDDLRFADQKGGEGHYFTNKDGNRIKVGAHYDSYTFNVKKLINDTIEKVNLFVDSLFFQMGGIAA